MAPRSGPASLLACVALGMVAALPCLLTGAMVIGIGHGWEVPFQDGLLSLLLYPLAAMRWWWVDRTMPWRCDAGATAVVAVPMPAAFSMLGVMSFLLPAWPLLPAGAALWWIAARLLARWGRQVVVGDVLLLLVGLALGVAAWADNATSSYVARSWPSQLLWLPFWLGWQLVAVAALVRHLRPAVSRDNGSTGRQLFT